MILGDVLNFGMSLQSATKHVVLSLRDACRTNVNHAARNDRLILCWAETSASRLVLPNYVLYRVSCGIMFQSASIAMPFARRTPDRSSNVQLDVGRWRTSLPSSPNTSRVLLVSSSTFLCFVLCDSHLDGEVLDALAIRSSTCSPKAVERLCNVRPHDWDSSSKASYCSEEVAKQDQDAVQLDKEAEERPAHKNQRDTESESGCALPFLPARKESEGLLCADNQSEAD